MRRRSRTWATLAATVANTTRRAHLIRAMVAVTDPQDWRNRSTTAPAGRLASSVKPTIYMRHGMKKLTTSELKTLQEKTFYGKEKKSLAYVIGDHEHDPARHRSSQHSSSPIPCRKIISRHSGQGSLTTSSSPTLPLAAKSVKKFNRTSRSRQEKRRSSFFSILSSILKAGGRAADGHQEHLPF